MMISIDVSQEMLAISVFKSFETLFGASLQTLSAIATNIVEARLKVRRVVQN